MTNYLEILDLSLPTNTPAGKARQRVLAATSWTPTPTTIVTYVAASRVLLIADRDTAEFAAKHIVSPVQLYVADVQPQAKVFVEGTRIDLSEIQLSGYLGRFTAWFGDPADRQSNVAYLLGISNGLFDQIIDCSVGPRISAAIPPPGYHHVGSDREALAAVLAAAPDLIGEFDKPKYFDYDPSICAHGRSGIPGCTRCLEACPTEAIISIGEQIEVNSHLCQGGGTCTTSCPSGAITYRYPPGEEQIALVRSILRDLRADDEFLSGAALLLFDSEAGAAQVSEGIGALPEHVIPIRVEEIGVVGPDLIAAALAFGAREILILVPPATPLQVRASLQRDVSMISAILEQLELEGYSVNMVRAIEEVAELPAEPPIIGPATFAAIGNKRTLIRSAVQHLAAQSDRDLEQLYLPEGSLFGQVKLNYDACTLCMACVSVCPVGALEAGGESPALKFIEANCVQCGICTRACPESALRLESRLHLDDDTVRRSRVLKEEEPFRCIKCNKAFATQAMIGRIAEKLGGHWMFETPEAMNRLKMCEDCRVADMYDRKDMIS